MQVLTFRGPSEAVSSLVDGLAPRLDGRVALVDGVDDESSADAATDGGPDRDRPAGVDEQYVTTPDGWVGSGAPRSLGALLDDLAPRHDYALVTGYPDAALPTVVVGTESPDETDADRDVVLAAADPDAVDLAALAARADDLEPHVTLESLVRRAKASPLADRAGAVATFTGRVRAKDSADDAPTTHLAFEKYEGIAEEHMATIREELTAREGVHEVLMHHRTGVIPDGEDIVFVVVLAGHREEAFRAVEDGINRLKAEVPLFKKETTVEDEFWVHER